MAKVAGDIIINYRHNPSYTLSLILLNDAVCSQPQKEDIASGREKEKRQFCYIYALYLLKLYDTSFGVMFSFLKEM